MKNIWKRLEPGGRRQCVLAAALALAGAVLYAVRPLGMRFSGMLLLGLAALLLVALWLRYKAADGRFWRRCRRGFHAALAVVLTLLCSIEIFVVTQGRRDLTALPADAVIVLGAGVNGTTPSLSLATRLDAALSYLEAHPDIPVVLTGGQGYGEDITEAACMYDYLTERGVEPERLILEESASNTSENFAFSAPLLEAAGVDIATDTVAVVTNDFHVARSRLIARKKGYGVTVGVGAPIPWAHLEVNYSLREAFAVVKSVLLD
ncbi:YdcF family protein [uncultured Oscillibacter sp.]|uniref:YdcF family protein n=1 Tax=uncultured Oscillibacter sp. TaxID=876091 RepID=UPI0025CE7FB4|nr:YdcF family protein [uncultured Oscillibacter sp.]